MKSSTFRLLRYKAPSAEWDHDHCFGCRATFAEFDGPDIEHQGYCTSLPVLHSPDSEFIEDVKNSGMLYVKAPSSGGFALHWVCSRCFEDFREELGFKIEAP